MNAVSINARFRLERPAFRLDVDLDIPLAGITGIFGPSGSGKTTLLRCMAGLERVDDARLAVGDDLWQDSERSVFLPVQSRDVGYVFQEARLFPHLDVRGNLDYSIRRRRADAAVDEAAVIELLGIGPLMARRPVDLSGGEAQRVAIARALLRGPRLVLMDEPLASLDRARKDELMPFLDRLHAELSLPIVYVSHSIEEICRLCDHLVVIDDGRVLASGPIQSVLTRAPTRALAGEDAGSVVEAIVESYDAVDELTRLRFSGGEFLVAGAVGRTGERLRLRVRASDVSLVAERPERSSILNILPAVVASIDEAGGGMAIVHLEVGAEVLLARVTRRSVRDLELSPGDRIHAQVKSAAIRNVPTAGHLDRENAV
jgi:molybdate transport system ATP-binding protein